MKISELPKNLAVVEQGDENLEIESAAGLILMKAVRYFLANPEYTPQIKQPERLGDFFDEKVHASAHTPFYAQDAYLLHASLRILSPNRIVAFVILAVVHETQVAAHAHVSQTGHRANCIVGENEDFSECYRL